MREHRLGRPLSEPASNLGWRFYNLRRAYNWDRRAAAGQFRISAKSYASYERGDRVPPGPVILLLEIFERSVQNATYGDVQMDDNSHPGFSAGYLRIRKE